MIKSLYTHFDWPHGSLRQYFDVDLSVPMCTIYLDYVYMMCIVGYLFNLAKHEQSYKIEIEFV